MNRLLPHPWWMISLALLWLLIVGTVSLGQALLGLVLGLVIPWIAHPLLPTAIRPRRPYLLIPYTALVIWDIMVASVQVARLVLFQPRDAFRPAWISVPVDLDRPAALALLAGTITLTPGTLSADVSSDGRAILVHCLHAPDPAQVVADIRARYESRLKRIFG